MTNPNDRIFPIAPAPDHQRSLTKREYFAAQFMAALLSIKSGGTIGVISKTTAIIAVHCADDLIDMLNKAEYNG